MRALWRPCLTSLVMATAALLAATAAHPAAGASTHHTAALVRGCPAGTNWDGATNSCH